MNGTLKADAIQTLIWTPNSAGYIALHRELFDIAWDAYAFHSGCNVVIDQEGGVQYG